MKKVFGYIRVSTAKQGTGVSLQEQKEAIIRYASKNQLNIIEWFKEQETAAKQGRPLFNKMMKLVRSGKASGVIIHKIDRSARNLRDWASLGDMIDQGYEIHFAHESLDLETRGGRLAADIQAVIASDYIRNLRDETIKGLYGRLKQGIYPFGAPIGYLDNGSGKLKTIDPINGPIIQKAFQLYSSGEYSLVSLAENLNAHGLKNMKGNPMSVNTLSKVLNNAFYTGLLKVKGKTFQGNHDPLISSSIFLKVQDILKRKTRTRIIKNNFLYSRMIKCNGCNYSLIGERVKSYVYYRCHQKECSTKTIREDRVQNCLMQCLDKIQLSTIESNTLNEILKKAQINWTDTQKGIEDSLRLQFANVSNKLNRLTDAFIEGTIDKVLFDLKKQNLIIESNGLKMKLSQISNEKDAIFRKVQKFLELLKNLKNSFEIGIHQEKRNIMKYITSNFTIEGKKLGITMNLPFSVLANRTCISSGDHLRDTPLNHTAENDKMEINAVVAVDTQVFQAQMQRLLNIILEFCAKSVEFEKNNEIEDYDETKHPSSKFGI